MVGRTDRHADRERGGHASEGNPQVAAPCRRGADRCRHADHRHSSRGVELPAWQSIGDRLGARPAQGKEAA